MDADVQEKGTRRRIGPAVAVGVATVGAWTAIVYGLATAVMGWGAVQAVVGMSAVVALHGEWSMGRGRWSVRKGRR